LNKHWRESRQKKERLRGRRESGSQASRINIPTNARET